MRSFAFTITRKNYFKKGNRVVVRRELRQGAVLQHRHEFFEIAVVLSGKAIHVTGDYRHPVNAGDVLVLNPKRTHGYEDPQNFNLINILISNNALLKMGKSLNRRPGFRHLFGFESSRWRKKEYLAHIRLSSQDMDKAHAWIEHMEQEAKKGHASIRLLEEASLVLLIDLLCSRYIDQNTFEKNPSGDPSSKLGKILGWMENNLHRDLRVEDLARKMGLSERSFYRLFQEELKISPRKYLADMRMRRAEDLLSDHSHGKESITEIALACGFEDSNYFTRCFHRFKKMSPREFQKEFNPVS